MLKHSQVKKYHLHQVNFINKEIWKWWIKTIQTFNYQIMSLKLNLPNHHFNINLYLVAKSKPKLLCHLILMRRLRILWKHLLRLITFTLLNNLILHKKWIMCLLIKPLSRKSMELVFRLHHRVKVFSKEFKESLTWVEMQSEASF